MEALKAAEAVIAARRKPQEEVDRAKAAAAARAFKAQHFADIGLNWPPPPLPPPPPPHQGHVGLTSCLLIARASLHFSASVSGALSVSSHGNGPATRFRRSDSASDSSRQMTQNRGAQNLGYTRPSSSIFTRKCRPTCMPGGGFTAYACRKGCMLLVDVRSLIQKHYGYQHLRGNLSVTASKHLHEAPQWLALTPASAV